MALSPPSRPRVSVIRSRKTPTDVIAGLPEGKLPRYGVSTQQPGWSAVQGAWHELDLPPRPFDACNHEWCAVFAERRLTLTHVSHLERQKGTGSLPQVQFLPAVAALRQCACPHLAAGPTCHPEMGQAPIRSTLQCQIMKTLLIGASPISFDPCEKFGLLHRSLRNPPDRVAQVAVPRLVM